jgi:hypothetical protein
VGSLTITLVESGTPDTDAKPDVSYTRFFAASIVSVSTAEEVADFYSFTSTTDGAGPVIISAVTDDVNPAGGDGKSP